MLATSAEVGRFRFRAEEQPSRRNFAQETHRTSVGEAFGGMPLAAESGVSGRSASSRILALAGGERHSKRWAETSRVVDMRRGRQQWGLVFGRLCSVEPLAIPWSRRRARMQSSKPGKTVRRNPKKEDEFPQTLVLPPDSYADC